MTWDKSNQGCNEPTFLNEDGMEPATGIVRGLICVIWCWAGVASLVLLWTAVRHSPWYLQALEWLHGQGWL